MIAKINFTMEETDKMIIKVLVEIKRFLKKCVVLSLYLVTYMI